MPRHAHATAGLSVVLSGGVVERVGSADVDADALSFVTKPAGVEHADQFGPGGARLLAIEFGAGFFPDGVFPPWRWIRGSHGMALAGRLLRAVQLTAGSDDPDREDILLDAIVPLLDAADAQPAEPSEPTHGVPHWLGEVRMQLDDTYRSYTSMESLAASVGVHRVHLAREFRRHFGCTATDYLRGRRVRAVASDLADSSLPIAAVACDVGFSDQSHMSRHFKAATGMSPGMYRRLARS
jgi:AraC family transcriptional regulator